MQTQTRCRQDPAIQEMKPPTTVSELYHFMGMVNQLIMHRHMDWKQYCCRRLSLSGNPSCIMMNKERRYAQIEKMALALCGHANSSLITF